ncbi:trafficking protein particle complex subunit 2-like protein [Hydra vulgaris]|uniref:trafficking protein particle complex subunit 2-like protein n=1 Tax=Hydra vulgaris TaxID=6087 RepID=UPI0001925832|nr:trafficking protein particle complex subunit 2-like protein [Hydra vulgaris]
MALSVAVVGKDNEPLYVHTSSPDTDLKFHYIIHTCLDVIEEKTSSLTKSTQDPRELYLGLLYPTEDYKVYGYVTNTKIKFVIVVDSGNATLRDNDIRMMFRKVHSAYVAMVSNPFYNHGDPIKSTMFQKAVDTLMVTDGP